MKRSFLTLICCFVLVTGLVAQENSETSTGIQLYCLGKFDEAAAVLEKAVESGKFDRDTRVYLAAAYAHLGRKSEAAKLLRKAYSDKGDREEFDTELKLTKRSTPSCADVYANGFGGATTRLAIEFLSNGQIGLVIPFYTNAPPHDRVAAEVVRKFKFEPAIIAGQPVTTVGFFTFDCQIGH